MLRSAILECAPVWFYGLVHILKMDEVGCYETSIPVYQEESTAIMITETASVRLYRHDTAFHEYDIQIHT
jgi:hypothetical protein